ncbi:MAG: hypothetical protein KatS3mg090_0628 [Patescibacteria group bacterium]|nr:MAG: hypothetical protein KatS3mg090_0628 [Patescibacteria group bacterium]
MLKKLFLIFFSFLIIVVAFVSGVRYGRSLEVDEKYINTLAKIESESEQSADLGYVGFKSFKMVELENCSLKILVPDSAEVSRKDSSLNVSYKDLQLFEISCLEKQPDLKIKTNTNLIFKGNFITAGDFGDFVVFDFKHPKKNIWYQFKAEKSVYPLLNAVEFL